jgi:hypothetical protein
MIALHSSSHVQTIAQWQNSKLLICIDRSGFRFWPTLVLTLQRRHLMGSPPSQRFPAHFAISLWIYESIFTPMKRQVRPLGLLCQADHHFEQSSCCCNCRLTLDWLSWDTAHI